MISKPQPARFVFVSHLPRIFQRAATLARRFAGICRTSRPVLVILIILGASISGPAEGFRNPPAGAYNLGRAGGRIAQIDDASAVVQNPANLADLTEPQLLVAPSLVYLKVKYRSPSGQAVETVDPWKNLPNSFLAWPLAGKRMAIGLGMITPYGLSNEWDPSLSSPIRYTAPYFTELKTININPGIGYRLTDSLTVGAGLNLAWSQVTFKQFLSPALPQLYGKAKGDGYGGAGNIGVSWDVAPRHRLSATYRSPLTIDYEGHFVTKHSPFGTTRSEFDTQIKFPSIVAVGYGFQVTDMIRLESDFEWIQFSRFQSLPVNIGANPLGVPSTKVRHEWNDTFTAGLAGDWRFTPHWVLRAGYQFYQSPVPDRTLSPTIPDADQHVLTVGLGWQGRRHGLEIAYGLDFYDDRTVTHNLNPAFNGTYEMTVHLFAFNYRYIF